MRRLDTGTWILGGFLSSGYALGYRTIDSPTADLYEAEVQTPVVGTTWDAQDLANNQVAQLYGGYVLPGSQLDTQGGVGLVVSQWDTATGWPYRTMQFKVTLTDTTRTSNGSGPTIKLTKPARKSGRAHGGRQPRLKDARPRRPPP